MILLSLFRQSHLSILFLALFFVGCATTGRIIPPESPKTTVVDVTQPIPVDSISSVAYHLLRQTFVARTTHPERVPGLLDSLALILPQNFGKNPVINKRLTGLVRATIECYHAILPQNTILSPNSSIAQFLESLPRSVSIDLANHPYFFNLYARKLAGQADVPIDYMPEVDYYVRYFHTGGRDFFARWLSRSTAYLPMIQSEFQKKGLPKDLAYKAMIESGFYPFAESRVRAVGMWQFMRPAAAQYGLKNDSWIDERREPEKATKAAASYLKKLYKDFGDWRLVVAAYNCGEGRLERAMRSAKTRNFWDAYTLPTETRGHVPKFMAAVIIAKDPAWFGFTDVVYQPPLAYETVAVSEPVSLRLAAECAGTSYAWMQQLNAELHRGYTPPVNRKSPYLLRVPEGSAEKFKANYAQLPAEKKTSIVNYVVKSGDTLSKIARKLGVTTQALMAANNIDNPKKVRVGRKLTIPLRPDSQPELAVRSEPSKKSSQPSAVATTKTKYTVRNGDTLWSIAKQKGVTVSQLRTWNKLKASHAIRPGDQLVLQLAQTPNHTYYTVRSGDTLWDIARTFQANIEDLKSWNGIRHPSSIRAGDRIRVRSVSDDHVAD